jgi:hypothetical protein
VRGQAVGMTETAFVPTLDGLAAALLVHLTAGVRTPAGEAAHPAGGARCTCPVSAVPARCAPNSLGTAGCGCRGEGAHPSNAGARADASAAPSAGGPPNSHGPGG